MPCVNRTYVLCHAVPPCAVLLTGDWGAGGDGYENDYGTYDDAAAAGGADDGSGPLSSWAAATEEGLPGWMAAAAAGAAAAGCGGVAAQQAAGGPEALTYEELCRCAGLGCGGTVPLN